MANDSEKDTSPDFEISFSWEKDTLRHKSNVCSTESICSMVVIICIRTVAYKSQLLGNEDPMMVTAMCLYKHTK